LGPERLALTQLPVAELHRDRDSLGTAGKAGGPDQLQHAAGHLGGAQAVELGARLEHASVGADVEPGDEGSAQRRLGGQTSAVAAERPGGQTARHPGRGGRGAAVLLGEHGRRDDHPRLSDRSKLALDLSRRGEAGRLAAGQSLAAPAELEGERLDREAQPVAARAGDRRAGGAAVGGRRDLEPERQLELAEELGSLGLGGLGRGSRKGQLQGALGPAPAGDVVEDDLEAAVYTLLEAAIDRGGKDNVTIILVKVLERPQSLLTS